MSKSDLDRLLNKALQAPSFGGGCVIPITVPYLAFDIRKTSTKSYIFMQGLLDGQEGSG